MRVILFNTCGTDASIALADTDLPSPVIAQSTIPGRTASEALVSVLREALSQQGWSLKQINAIIVVAGPGSFTGVRVGLAMAKGLNEAAGIPIIAISRLAILGAAAGKDAGRVCAFLDAGRGEFYCGRYLNDEEQGETLVSREEASRIATEADIVIVCEETALRGFEGVERIKKIAEPSAAAALPLAMKRLDAGLFDDPLTLDANYLRRTDAEIFAKPEAQRAG